MAEFVATAAHELRAPLTIVAGLASTLRDSRWKMPAAAVDEAFDSMVRQCGRMTLLIENLLDLTQLEAGYQPAVEPIAAAEVVADALEFVPPPDAVTVEVREEEPGLAVRAERCSPGRILINLLSNAYRYGGSHIVVDMHRDGADGVVAVADNGPGLPPAVVPSLFEPFTRGPNARGVAGSGLGLALSRRLAESLGGELIYAAESPQGCKFVLRLPPCEVP